MTEPRHFADQLALSLFWAEPAYDVNIHAWLPQAACSMRDFDGNAAHEVYDDLVTDDDALIHNAEYPLVQELVRQSVRLTYEEPRTKPNTLAGLLALSLGSTVPTQDGSALAYRHAIAPSASPLDLPSIAVQTAHMGSGQYVYTGVKADSFTLRNNGAYLSFTCPLIGSGRRGPASDAFASVVDERWLRWGDCHIYVADVRAAALALEPEPMQGSTNLGLDAIDLSTRVLRLEVNHPNTLWAEGGYRPSTRQLRGALVTPKRRTDVVLELQVDSATEAQELGWYLEQAPLALEWQCVGDVIDLAGTFRWGFTAVLPRIQWRTVRRQEQSQFDTLALEGRVLDDQVNPVVLVWVYNAQARYLVPVGAQALQAGVVIEPWDYSNALVSGLVAEPWTYANVLETTPQVAEPWTYTAVPLDETVVVTEPWES